METRPDVQDAGPGIRVPPPFFFVVGWVTAWLLERRIGFAIDGAGASVAQELFGAILILAGLVGVGAGVGMFHRARTSVLPMRPAHALVTSGPYRWTRNPMYLSMTSLYVGLAAVVNLAWPVVLLPAVLAALSVFVIEREERYLVGRFGAEYESYRARVRRWV